MLTLEKAHESIAAPVIDTTARKATKARTANLNTAEIPVRVRETAPAAALLLIATDALLLPIAISFASILTGQSSTTIQLPTLLLLLPVLGLNFSMQLYPGYGVPPVERLRRRWLGGMVALPVLVLLTALMNCSLVLPLVSALIYLALAPLGEDITRSLLHHEGLWGRPVLLLAPEAVRLQAARTLRQNWILGLQASAHLKPGKDTTLVLAPGAVLTENLSECREIYLLREAGQLGRLKPAVQGLPSWLPTITACDPSASPCSWGKRMIDLSLGILIGILSLPLIAICAALVYVADPGPVFYSQIRRGQNGIPVRIWKIRSMYLNSQQRLDDLLAHDKKAAAEWYARYKLAHDPRVLPRIGHFIRKFSIDELPQLLNVVCGEVSLVGPRIFVDYDLAVYGPEALQLRQSVKPGLTGLWQVSVRNSGDNADKIRYDCAYVNNWTLWSDVDILYRTVGVVLTGRGAS